MDTPPRRIVLLGAGPLPHPGSTAAPGVANRLWQFAWTLIKAGHDCLVLTFQPDGLGVEGWALAAAERRELDGQPWRHLALNWPHEAAPPELHAIVKEFNPERGFSAGTLMAGSHLVQLRERQAMPIWIDLFGDPLAEIEAKREKEGADFDGQGLGLVWRMQLRVLAGMRAGDHCSTVSRRQADALLGQLALMGKLIELEHGGGEQLANPTMRVGESASRQITVLPCCVEAWPAKPQRGRGLELRAERQIAPEARVIIWSGGFNAWADASTLVRGIECAMDAVRELVFVATGGTLGGYFAVEYNLFLELVGQSRHRERMHALGWLPQADAAAWLAAAEVGVMTDRPCAETRLGARNRVLVHAAAGHPLIATRGSEVVEDLAVAGAIHAIPSGDAAALARAIENVVGNPDEARRVAERAGEFCAAHYTFAATAEPIRAWAGEPDAGDKAIGARPQAMLDYMGAMLTPLTRLPDALPDEKPLLERVLKRIKP